MYGVCVALIPTLLASLIFFGLGAAIVLATSVLSCVFFEWAISRFLLHKEQLTITDGSAVLTGLLLASTCRPICRYGSSLSVRW